MQDLTSLAANTGISNQVITRAFPEDLAMKIFHGLKIMLRRLKQSKSQKAVLQADIIKLKEAVEQAERKSMNKSLALVRASHDMRNALYSIVELIKFCQAQTTASSELQTNLARMNDYTFDLIDLLNTILDTSKVESGKMHLEQAEFNVFEIIEKSVDSFNILGEKKGLEIIWDPCDFSVLRLDKVIGDKRRFKQILDNLLGNAIKFTSEGKIVVRAWASEPELKILNISSDYGCSISHMLRCLSRRLLRLRKKIIQQDALHLQRDPYSIELTFEVDDTGIGIPIEKRASVFENYVQVKEDSPEGTGLGLGIVQSFVRLMGGEISIIDKEPGEKGTCFKFNIYLRPVEVAQQDMSRHEETNRSAIGEPFMIRESHSVNLHSLLFVQGTETKRILQAWIESLGIKVWTACLAEHISPTLEKIKHSINFSTKSDSALLCKTFSLKTGYQPGAELCSEFPLRVLVIVDLSNGNLAEILSTLTDFTERNTNLYCKIACLADSKVTEEELSKFRALLCDLTLRKPIHGSRLHELFKLIKDLEKAEELYVDRVATPPADLQTEEQSVKLCKITEGASTRTEDEKLLSGKHVLLVDDNEIMRRVGSAILSNEFGAKVEVAEDGSKALYLVKKTLQARGKHSDYSFKYDAIFMDCQMPVMDGYEAAIQIRKEESLYGIHIPIIALTADDSTEVVQKILDAGMDFHLEKPLNKFKVEKAFSHVNA